MSEECNTCKENSEICKEKTNKIFKNLSDGPYEINNFLDIKCHLDFDKYINSNNLAPISSIFTKGYLEYYNTHAFLCDHANLIYHIKHGKSNERLIKIRSEWIFEDILKRFQEIDKIKSPEKYTMAKELDQKVKEYYDSHNDVYWEIIWEIIGFKEL